MQEKAKIYAKISVGTDGRPHQRIKLLKITALAAVLLVFAGGGNSCKKPAEEIFCDCIMDTLRGEWRWVKTTDTRLRDTLDNEFESIVKILSQNEDGSINYEIFVEDTLFYRGSFEILQIWATGVFTDIKLPHNYDVNWQLHWTIHFGGRPGTSGRDIISFQIGATSMSIVQFYYQRIK